MTCEVYGALKRLVVMCLLGLCQVTRIHAVHKMGCFLNLMIQDRQVCYLDGTLLLHVALMQSRVLCPSKVDQLQEGANTSVAHLGDNYSFSQIFLGRLSWNLQTHYFEVM
jgi:hypothetical protein